MPTQFKAPQKTSVFRRIAASMWGRPNDPTIYGFVDIDVTDTMAFIERFRAETGTKLTVTHVVCLAVARAFAKHPELNAKVQHWGKLVQRETVDLFISVATEGGRDLSGARVDAADGLGLEEIIAAIDKEVNKTRTGTDENIRKSRSLMGKLPWWLVRPALWLTNLLSNEWQLHLPGFGMPRDPFGTAIVTNVGMFGIDTAFAPFIPMARCPLLLLVTAVRSRPWVVDDKVVPRKILRLCATFDHRIIDGFQAGRMAEEITRFVENPAGDNGESARLVA